MPHLRLPRAIALAYLSIPFAACASAPVSEDPPPAREDPGVRTPEAKAPATDSIEDTDYARLVRLAQEEPSVRDGDRVIFRGLGSGATAADAVSAASTEARAQANRTRRTTVRTFAESIDTLRSQSGRVEESSEFTSRSSVMSVGEFTGVELLRAPYSERRTRTGFDAVAEIAVDAEQVFPAEALERFWGEGPEALLGYARRSRGRGDVQAEIGAYELALGQVENTDVLGPYGERLIDEGFSRDAADLYAKWRARFPDWVTAQIRTTRDRCVDRNVSAGRFKLALDEVTIWGQFDQEWERRRREEVSRYLDTPKRLVDDLRGLVPRTELNRQENRYYHPEDVAFSATLDWEEVTVRRSQNVRIKVPAGRRLSTICIRSGWIAIDPNCVGETPSRGLSATMEVGYDPDEQHEYRPGRVSYFLFVEAPDGSALGSASALELPDAVELSQLEGEGDGALLLRERLRAFIESLRTEIDAGRLDALHLEWSQR